MNSNRTFVKPFFPRWLTDTVKTLVWLTFCIMIAGLVLSAAGGLLYLFVHIIAVAWHSGK